MEDYVRGYKYQIYPTQKKETPKGVSWADSINLLEGMNSPRRANTFREFY